MAIIVFTMAAVTTSKINNIYFIYQLNVITRSDNVLKKCNNYREIVSDLVLYLQFKNINSIRSMVSETHKDTGPKISKTILAITTISDQ